MRIVKNFNIYFNRLVSVVHKNSYQLSVRVGVPKYIFYIVTNNSIGLLDKCGI